MRRLVALAGWALRCGAPRSSAIAAGGRHDGTRIAQALGFPHGTPWAATLHTLLRHVNREECEAHVGP